MLALATLFVCCTHGDLGDIFGPCCHEGVQWSSDSFRCDNYPAPVANISDADQAPCLSIIEVCCIKQTQVVACENGKQAALDSHLCAVRDTDPGAEQFRECCHCCQLGVVSRSTSQSCESPGLGEPCDIKFQECCRGQESGNVSFSGGSHTKRSNIPGEDPDSDGASHKTSNNNNNNIPSVAPTVDDGTTNSSSSSNSSTGETVVDEDDIDECTIYSGQLCSHLCVNTALGFYCDCPPGLTLDPLDNRTCLAVDGSGVPGDNVLANCHDNNPCDQRCVEKIGGGVQCRCYEGYRLALDAMACEDIDECAENLAHCAPSQICVNTPGRFTCMSSTCPAGYDLDPSTGRCKPGKEQCALGFKYSPKTGRCEDLNECGLGIDSCGPGERCENTVGSYTCRRERHCGTGYTLDEESQRCQDNNECELGTHNCGGGYKCQNIQGSFRCVPKPCEEGYRFDRVLEECVLVQCPVGLKPNRAGNCVDINECEEYGPTICRRHQRCKNTRGSYYCRSFVNCPPGYEPTENSGCQDIDECDRGTHKCGPEQQCINRQGTYFCQCPRGMRHDNTGSCVDVDECSYGAAICPSNSKCVNTPGSFTCDCVDGLVSDGQDHCTDVDECEQEGICQQSCVNVLGTFFCSCNRGYQLRDDKRSCEDIDECTQFRGRGGRSSVCGGRCINLPGSYRCECPDGWRLKPDSRSCEDINECREGSAYCPHSESMCINTRGGYKCPVVRCPDGFIKTNGTAHKNSIRCKRVSTSCAECRRGLISRTYNFISFASNVIVPAPLFSMTGSRLVDKFYSWNLDLISARPLRVGVEVATEQHFTLEKSRDFARVTLIRRIEGPQDVVLKLTMNVTSYYKGFEGMAESRIYLYVTEEDSN